MFADPLTERLTAFMRGIGIPVRDAGLAADALLPGLDIRDGAIVVAWSYAALRFLELDPAIVFHPDGYKGISTAIIHNFEAGYCFSVPLLQLYAMSSEPRQAAEKGVAPFPHMLRWVR
jgi:hypothetical protein